MPGISQILRLAAFTVALVVVALLSSDPALAEKPIEVTDTGWEGNVVMLTLQNTTSEDLTVKVEVCYVRDRTAHRAQTVIEIGEGRTVEVELELETITDDIDPLGIIEDPDPIPGYVVFGTALWGD
jgi:hypothetical protein